jgi:hypothetical protein
VEVCPGRPSLLNKKKAETKVRVPNIQTIVEKCQPGDVILFDPHCQKPPDRLWPCRGGWDSLFYAENDGKKRSIEAGAYEHCGEFHNVS